MLPELIWEWINTGKTYIFMGLVRHDELTRLFRDLEWNFSEFGEAGFTWHGRNSYGFNRLFLIREGEGSLMNHSACESLRLEPGFACFMPPQLDLEFDFPAGFRFFSFHFRVEVMPGVDLFSGKTDCVRFDPGEETMREVAGIAALQPGWSSFFALHRFICGILLRLAPQITLDWEWRNRLKARYGTLLEYMRVRANAGTTVEELAEVAGRSYDRLSREFRRDFGRTLKEFLAAELCRRAESRLRRGDLSIKEIAAELGFGSEFYFSRFFRRHTGMAPRDYRQSRF